MIADAIRSFDSKRKILTHNKFQNTTKIAFSFINSFSSLLCFRRVMSKTVSYIFSIITISMPEID